MARLDLGHGACGCVSTWPHVQRARRSLSWRHQLMREAEPGLGAADRGRAESLRACASISVATLRSAPLINSPYGARRDHAESAYQALAIAERAHLEPWRQAAIRRLD